MRRALILTFLLACSSSGSAQEIFVAPTRHTIIGSSEQSGASDNEHVLYVRNESTVPIVVFGYVLTDCENVRQWCSGQRTNIVIRPGGRQTIAHVGPKRQTDHWNYRWNFSYRADSSDAAAMAVLREHGLTFDQLDAPPRTRIALVKTMGDSAPPLLADQPPRVRLTAEERSGGYPPRRPDDPEPTVTSFKFKVAYGSILGSTMMPGAPIQPTGPCIDPAQTAMYERDAKIGKTPWRVPVFGSTFGYISLPSALRDSTLRSEDVLVRFATDTTGEAIPGSASVLESSYGSLSVSACMAAISAKATPARDKAGKAIRAWVQVPLRVRR
jgi:hypothetical protein